MMQEGNSLLLKTDYFVEHIPDYLSDQNGTLISFHPVTLCDIVTSQDLN